MIEMERCGVQYRARSSFEKAHGEAPPRLQVIGFTVCAPKADTKEGLQEIISASASPNETHLLSFENKPSPSLLKPASSPRSALQQLLLNQSLPSTSPVSADHSLPLGLLPLPPPPPSSSSGPLTPGSSSPSANHTLTSGLLQQRPAISPPAANQNWTSGVSKPLGQSPSAHRSSGRLKSLLQSENASCEVPAKQRSRTSLFSSLGQSQCASSSASGNQRPIKEKYDAFFGIKLTDDEACYEEKKKFNNRNDEKPHEIKEGMISAQEVINELPHVEKCSKSSWLNHYDEHPSAEKCQKSSWKGVQQINERPLGNEKSRKSSWTEEKSKKSNSFMFVVSSPAPESHDRHNYGEYNMSEDMDFLSSCHLCRRRLCHGEDVFMYSGDKAFCSMECRYQQIVIDERKERCPPPIIRSGASQVYQHTSITTTATTHHPIIINKPHFINTAAAA